ncbi:suppressor of fused domain protein [Anatilimnocola floriformis]|uniref:suppressor of fused domain protein n=1 Tax=Anatilimnocola floriformis TaxID=2948575 RepID=UPI0020C207D9|nr:suppressor of fused domain protein [Anatilimnocola floriformis]
MIEPREVIREHLRRFFAGHSCDEHVWTLGPALDELPRLFVLEFAPGPQSRLWTYVTVGAWEVRAEPRLEFMIAAPDQDQRHVELLFMTAWYHGNRGLGTGHTLPIGESWLPGSKCDFFLVSLPYPFGPQLEICNLPDWHLHVLWLLPITSAEREFKVREGLEALEQRFDAAAIEYWSPNRPSVV